MYMVGPVLFPPISHLQRIDFRLTAFFIKSMFLCSLYSKRIKFKRCPETLVIHRLTDFKICMILILVSCVNVTRDELGTCMTLVAWLPRVTGTNLNFCARWNSQKSRCRFSEANIQIFLRLFFVRLPICGRVEASANVRAVWVFLFV